MTFDALSTAAADGSIKLIERMSAAILLAFRKSSKQTVAVPCPQPQS